jgi:O-antigen/teichoic acid export membrane protein
MTADPDRVSSLATDSVNQTAPAEAAPQGTGSAGWVKKAALSSAAWIGVGFLASYAIRLISSIIMTRLLLAEEFGLMNLVMAFLQGLYMFSDVGIGTSIVQSSRGDDPDFQNTAWTVQIVRGWALWGCAVLIAWPAAAFYETQALLWLVPAVGFTAVISGFTSTARYTLERRMLRGRLMAVEVGTAIASLVVTVAWAVWVQKNVWALVAGSMTLAVLNTALSHVLISGFRNRLRWDPTAVHDLLRFGKWIFLGTICTFFAFQSDRLLVPKLADFTTLGVYGVALTLVQIATSLMSTFGTQLVFPVYSRLRQAGRDIRSAFVRVHSSAAAFAALLVAGLLTTGPTGVRVVYPPAFHGAGWIVQLLAVGAWFQMLECAAGEALLALGKPRAAMVGNATKLIGLLILVPLGYWLGRHAFGDGDEHRGFIGMILGFVAADLGRYLMTVWMARRHGMSAWTYDIGLSFVILAISPLAMLLGGWLAGLLVGDVTGSRPREAVKFLCEGTAVVSLWGLVVLIWRFRGNFRLRAFRFASSNSNG